MTNVMYHFNYQLNYEVENSYFSAKFENDTKNVYIQVPRQHGYKLPTNPIKEIVLLENALNCYDVSTGFFDKIDEPIVVLDYYNESKVNIIKNDNIYYISYSYLSSILNNWNEIRLLRDKLLGLSSSEKDEIKHNVNISNDEDINVKAVDYVGAAAVKDAVCENGSCSVEESDAESNDDNQNEILDGCVEVTDSNMDDLFEKDIEEPQIEESDCSDSALSAVLDNSVVSDVEEDVVIDKKDVKETSESKGFSFFDVLNNNRK